MKTNWPTKKLGEVCEVSSGGSAPQGKQYFQNGKYPFFRTSDVGAVHLSKNLCDTRDYLNDQGVKKLKLFKKGTILFPKSGASTFLNHRVVMGCDGYVSSHLATISANKDEVLPDFLFYLLQRVDARGLTADQSYPSLRLSDLENLEILLPSLEVQKKIVAKLESVLAKISEAKKLRAEARENVDTILSAELHKIFEEGKKKGWEEKKFSEVCDLNPKKSEVKDEQETLSVSFVPMAAVDEHSQTIVSLEDRKLGEVRKGYTYFRDGDVLFAKITPCMENGKVAIAQNLTNGIGFGTTEFHVLRPKQEVLAEWIYSIIRHPQFRNLAKEKMTGSAGQKRVPVSFLEKYQIPVPPLTEQKKIIARLDTISQKVEAVKELQDQTENEFSTLESSVLSKAFSGELVEEEATVQQPIPSPFYRNQVNAAIVEQVTADGGSTTEVAVAKYNHLLQEICGVPLGYEFATHKFGSFDPKIKNLLWSGLADRNKWFTKRHGMVVEGQKIGALLSRKTNLYWKAKAGMKQLADLGITKLNADKIELLSTVYHSIKQVGSADLQKVRKFMGNWQTNGNQTKADKFTEEQTGKCIDFIVQHNLLKN